LWWLGEDSVKGNYSLNTFPVSLLIYIKIIITVRFEGLAAVVMKILSSVIQHRLVQLTFIGLHGVISQNIEILIITLCYFSYIRVLIRIGKKEYVVVANFMLLLWHTGTKTNCGIFQTQ
jgi:hypothetical protein